jgi:hypothetical protein
MPRTDRFIPEKGTRYPPLKRIGGTQGRSARLWKESRPPPQPPNPLGFAAGTVQPAGSISTLCATPAAIHTIFTLFSALYTPS